MIKVSQVPYIKTLNDFGVDNLRSSCNKLKIKCIINQELPPLLNERKGISYKSVDYRLRRMRSSASFSTCKDYRWYLSRYINENPKTLIFVGLNPSLANQNENDPTLKRLIGFAELWGYGSLVVVNLFARITKSPKFLASCKDPVGFKNDFELNKRISYWETNDSCDLWIGWGISGRLRNRDTLLLKRIKESSKKPYVIGLTKDGYPQHPLYTSKQKTLFQMKL